jgi:predicted metalloprotease
MRRLSNRRRRLSMSTVLGAAVAVMTAGCSVIVSGEPVSVFADPFTVAGMRAVDGPTGLRPNISEKARDVASGDGGTIDQIAAQSISDIEQFWTQSYGEVFPGAFKPVSELISWDPDHYDGVFCEDETHGLVNAAFCPLDNTIGWDRTVLLPALRKAYGDMAITMVLAHEYGHSVQRQAGLARRDTPTLVSEQQADCFAGAYMRWVAEDKSPRFTLSTGDGLNNLLASMIAFRDPLLSADDLAIGAGSDEHGSAFERISAFQFGFTDGPGACAAIDIKEVSQRRGDLPVALQRNESGDWPVSEESVRAIVDAMHILFASANPPTLSFDAAAAGSCPDARPSPPASFCPDTNTIVVDLAGLTKLGTAQSADDMLSALSGDNTAYSVLMSRYMLALQHQKPGLILDSAEAGLRTACLTGVATTKLADGVNTPNGNTVALTAGDLDEAVAGLLTNGLAAGDVNGAAVPAGFSRIDAFRIGVLGDVPRCLKRFP